jgi:hypothetical protein
MRTFSLAMLAVIVANSAALAQSTTQNDNAQDKSQAQNNKVPLPQITIGGSRAPAQNGTGTQGGPADCNNVKSGSSEALACLNQQLQGKVDSVNPGTPTAPIDAKSSDLKVGTVNLSAVKQQYGKNYGVSVVPYRPNLVPGAPRLGR